MEEPRRRIALLPAPGFLSHLIQFIELANKLVSHHHFTISIIIPQAHNSPITPQTTSLLQQLPPPINSIFLPPPSTADLPDDVTAEVLLPTVVTRSLPALRRALSELGTPAAALVVDLFAPAAIDIAREFKIPAYIFYVAAANDLSLSLDATSASKPVFNLPGSVALEQEDLPDSVRDRNSDSHSSLAKLCNKYLSADGILINSFLELETEAFHDLQLRYPAIPAVYPVGPLIRNGPEKDLGRVSEWLNKQPPKSVLYISFGSVGALPEGQFRELAHGLEMSGKRFLWVVKSPQESVLDAYTKTSERKVNAVEFLPHGFLERTRGHGLVVESWAPQIRVLSHGSIGGYLTHCGWTSILESVVFGVPLIAWPLCFEQKINAVFLRDGLKGALRVRENENGIVEREDISEVVRELIEDEEGKRIRKKVMEVKIAGGNAVSDEGLSSKALAQVVKTWMNKM
ncbi:hypothetical protein C2S51_010424 [Perilla frutescens var. frutescens]|nr:hypothetical protein C2S51_010424 [Perilla frutescens var. frutescens]